MGKTVKVKSRYTDYILIVPGTALMALAINVVFEPAGLVTGGFSGLAIIIKSLTEERRFSEPQCSHYGFI